MVCIYVCGFDVYHEEWKNATVSLCAREGSKNIKNTLSVELKHCTHS